MKIWELVILAVGLAMDAFAVSICKGLSANEIKPRHFTIAGLYFGGFQAFMPLVGYFLGIGFCDIIERVDHWIAFVLLGLIGANMIRESFSKEGGQLTPGFDPRSMLPMAVATSIDALAVGVTLAFLKVNIWVAVVFIGVITFLLSAIGIWLGHKVGGRFHAKAEALGGVVLVLIGLKILLEHQGII